MLYHAHRAMEAITLDRGELHLKDEMGPRYSELVYNGFWFAPEREALQTMIDHTQVRILQTLLRYNTHELQFHTE